MADYNNIYDLLWEQLRVRLRLATGLLPAFDSLQPAECRLPEIYRAEPAIRAEGRCHYNLKRGTEGQENNQKLLDHAQHLRLAAAPPCPQLGRNNDQIRRQENQKPEKAAIPRDQ